MVALSKEKVIRGFPVSWALIPSQFIWICELSQDPSNVLITSLSLLGSLIFFVVITYKQKNFNNQIGPRAWVVGKWCSGKWGIFGIGCVWVGWKTMPHPSVFWIEACSFRIQIAYQTIAFSYQDPWAPETKVLGYWFAATVEQYNGDGRRKQGLWSQIVTFKGTGWLKGETEPWFSNLKAWSEILGNFMT